MPWGLFKYGLSRNYPARRDIPAPRPLKKSYDVVIIGGGGHGLATAYHLARYHGITNVAVLEKGYIGGGNTGRNTTVIRSNYISPSSVAFYQASVNMFKNLSSELDYNMLYSQRGQLTLAHSDATLRLFRLRVEVNKHLGVRSELVDRERIREILPFLNMPENARFPICGGLWHADGGFARHDAVAWGYARRAYELGVEIHQRTEVTDIHTTAGRVTGVTTERGDIACKHVVQAVAGMSAVLARKAGFCLPIRAYPLQALVTVPLKPFLDPLVSSTALHVYFSQTARGEIVIAGGSDPYELYSTRSTLEFKESLIATALELFPFLANTRVVRQWAGITDMTPDYAPIMGQSPIENYWLDAGWGTWGFKATPIAGKCIAESIANGHPAKLIRPFKLDRFRNFELFNEASATAASH